MDTSYFGNLKLVKNPVSISGKAPFWYEGPEFKVLAPKYGFFSDYKAGKINAAEYTVQFYKQVLEPLDPIKIYQDLISKYGSDVTLLCYEKPGDFCHRRLVAAWLEAANNIMIPERSNVVLDPRLKSLFEM